MNNKIISDIVNRLGSRSIFSYFVFENEIACLKQLQR